MRFEAFPQGLKPRFDIDLAMYGLKPVPFMGLKRLLFMGLKRLPFNGLKPGVVFNSTMRGLFNSAKQMFDPGGRTTADPSASPQDDIRILFMQGYIKPVPFGAAGGER